MDNSEKKMIFKLVRKEISGEEFIDAFPSNLVENPNYFLNILQQSFEEKDQSDIEYALLVAYYFKEFKKFKPIVRKLVTQNWHNQHEDLINFLASEVDLNDADYFYHVLNSNYTYISDIEDFLVPIWVKCIWALGKIGTVKSKKYLENFINSEYERVSKATMIQFKKNNWELNK